MRPPRTIVMLWYQQDWGLFGRRYEMLARTWADTFPQDQVLVVEPPTNLWIWSRNILSALLSRDRGLLRYWFARLPRLIQPLIREKPRLWVMQPFLPWVFRSTGEGRLTRWAWARVWAAVERFLVKEGKGTTPLLWAYPPHSFVLYGVQRWERKAVCVDLVDDNSAYEWLPENLRAQFRQAYERVLEKASIVFSVSPALQEKHSRPGRAVLCVPNAADRNGSAPTQWPVPDLPPGRCAGYIGHLDERLDVEFLMALFTRHPSTQFVFVGPFGPGFRRRSGKKLFRFPNAHYWGTVPYPHLKDVMKRFDVCLLPHRPSALTDSMDPLKLYVYVASGKPVIARAVRIPEALQAWVRPADTLEDFGRALAEEPLPGSVTAPPSSSAPPWSSRVAQMAEALESRS